MTATTFGSGGRTDSGERLWNLVDTTAPPERLAALRVLVTFFTLAYLCIRLPVFLQLADRRAGFDGVGLATLLNGPAPTWAVPVVVAVAFVSGVAAACGWWFRITGPVFALGVLALTSYRGSWGQLLHFENLFTLHLLIIGFAPAADAWSLDARRRRRSRPTANRRDGTAYGWPIALAGLTVVLTYVIAGVAKLRYGGADWVFGDSLRNHVAYASARNEVLGAPSAPLASWAVSVEGVWPVLAAGALVVELGAPAALFGRRLRDAWVIAAWLMHVGILLTMRIGFPYPLFLVAFAPFYRVELLWVVGARGWFGASPRKGLDDRPRASRD